jgi:hypothetical protein
MPDRFADQASGLTSPASDGFPITPDDTALLPEVVRAIYIGSGGTLVLELAGGTALTFAGLSGGTILPVRAQRIKATGTTAAALVGLI